MRLEQLDNQYRVTGFGYATDLYPDKATAIAEAMLHQLGEIKALGGHLRTPTHDRHDTVLRFRVATNALVVAIKNLTNED